MADKIRVGRHYGKIQKILYEKVVLTTRTYNIESTTNMTNKEMKDMEMIDPKKNVEESIQRTSINPILGDTD